MQITADISKISKTVQRDFNFICDVLLEYGTNFVLNLIFLATKMLLLSHKMTFLENEAA